MTAPEKTVKLTGSMYNSPYVEWHETIKEAARSAYYAIEYNEFFTISIETPEGKVWENTSVIGSMSQLRSLGEIEEDE